MSNKIEPYHRYLWKLSNEYAIGILSPEDIFNSVYCLLLVKIDELTDSEIKSLIVSRTIDLWRSEKLRRMKCDEYEEIFHNVTPLMKVIEIEITEIIYAMCNDSHMSKTYQNVTREIIFPSNISEELSDGKIPNQNQIIKALDKQGVRINTKTIKIICDRIKDSISKYFGVEYEM